MAKKVTFNIHQCTRAKFAREDSPFPTFRERIIYSLKKLAFVQFYKFKYVKNKNVILISNFEVTHFPRATGNTRVRELRHNL